MTRDEVHGDEGADSEGDTKDKVTALIDIDLTDYEFLFEDNVTFYNNQLGFEDLDGPGKENIFPTNDGNQEGQHENINEAENNAHHGENKADSEFDEDVTGKWLSDAENDDGTWHYDNKQVNPSYLGMKFVDEVRDHPDINLDSLRKKMKSRFDM
ncbi:hypothetical protein CsSME_00020391 [Camellia sinensis var. sinensis]